MEEVAINKKMREYVQFKELKKSSTTGQVGVATKNEMTSTRNFTEFFLFYNRFINHSDATINVSSLSKGEIP